MPEIEATPSGLPSIAKDEVLVVMGPPDGSRSPWVKELVDGSVKSLTKTHHYMTYHLGFLKDGAPYAVVDWQKPGASTLERRWVAQKLGAALTSQLNAKKLAVYLEPGSGMTELALAEDLVTRHTAPRYEKSLWAGARILSGDVPALKET